MSPESLHAIRGRGYKTLQQKHLWNPFPIENKILKLHKNTDILIIVTLVDKEYSAFIKASSLRATCLLLREYFFAFGANSVLANTGYVTTKYIIWTSLTKSDSGF